MTKKVNEYGLPPSAAKGAKAHVKPLPKKTLKQFKEAMFKVNIDSLPTMYVDGKSVGDIKQSLRKLLKKPSDSIQDVVRVQPTDVKKFYRDKVAGKDPEAEENVNEAVGPDSPDDKGEYDYEGEMAKNQLNTMIDAAKELHDMLGDDDNLPEWVQSKITKATDYIDSVRDYLKSESES